MPCKYHTVTPPPIIFLLHSGALFKLQQVPTERVHVLSVIV